MYGMFHEHFNPYCETSIPIYDLSVRAHLDRNAAMFWGKTSSRNRTEHKMLLRAIPGMSTVLGGDQWSYSEYSPKEVTDIYLYFLSVFLQKHPLDYKIKKIQCKNCRMMISFEERNHHIFSNGQRRRCVNCSQRKPLSLKEKQSRDSFVPSDTEITKMIANVTKSVTEIRSSIQKRSTTSTRPE